MYGSHVSEAARHETKRASRYVTKVVLVAVLAWIGLIAQGHDTYNQVSHLDVFPVDGQRWASSATTLVVLLVSSTGDKLLMVILEADINDEFFGSSAALRVAW